MSKTLTATAIAMLMSVSLAACGEGGSESKATDAKTTTAAPTPTPVPSETPQVDSDGDGTYDADDAFSNDPSRVSADDAAGTTTMTTDSTDSQSDWNLPKGYPKVVKVSSLPDQVRNWYEMDGTKKAVAIAPGVWAPISPGSSMDDAIEAGVYDGFCGSKKAFEKKYLGGEETAGTCW